VGGPTDVREGCQTEDFRRMNVGIEILENRQVYNATANSDGGCKQQLVCVSAEDDWDV